MFLVWYEHATLVAAGAHYPCLLERRGCIFNEGVRLAHTAPNALMVCPWRYSPIRPDFGNNRPWKIIGERA